MRWWRETMLPIWKRKSHQMGEARGEYFPENFKFFLRISSFLTSWLLADTLQFLWSDAGALTGSKVYTWSHHKGKCPSLLLHLGPWAEIPCRSGSAFCPNRTSSVLKGLFSSCGPLPLPKLQVVGRTPWSHYGLYIGNSKWWICLLLPSKNCGYWTSYYKLFWVLPGEDDTF